MKTAILIGDSIRLGYQDVVRQELAGKAEVWAPEENGGDSRNVLSHLHTWVLSKTPAVVHINCGLHDLKQEFGAMEPAVPLEEYLSNVRQILEQLLQTTRAKVIWATTTPVNEQWHHEWKGFDRQEAAVRAYNAAALQVATELGALINDLYAVVMAAGRDQLLTRDGVHFTDAGYALLGKTTAQAILQTISKRELQ